MFLVSSKLDMEVISSGGLKILNQGSPKVQLDNLLLPSESTSFDHRSIRPPPFSLSLFFLKNHLELVAFVHQAITKLS